MLIEMSLDRIKIMKISEAKNKEILWYAKIVILYSGSKNVHDGLTFLGCWGVAVLSRQPGACAGSEVPCFGVTVQDSDSYSGRNVP